MIITLLLGLAIVVVPAFIVLASLALLGTAIAGLADAAPHGFIRPASS